jgi:hypothetical protein
MTFKSEKSNKKIGQTAVALTNGKMQNSRQIIAVVQLFSFGMDPFWYGALLFR